MIKVCKVTVFLTWYSSAKACVLSTGCTMFPYPIHAFHVHIMIFPLGSISWKYTRPLCWEPGSLMLKDPVNKVQNAHTFQFRPFTFHKVHYVCIFQVVPFTLMTWFPHQVWYHKSVQEHCVYFPHASKIMKDHSVHYCNSMLEDQAPSTTYTMFSSSNVAQVRGDW